MAKITVILADDHTVVRDGLQTLLEMDGNISVVGTASDGQSAVRLAGKLKPDVIIMDVSMPKLNGIDATIKIMNMLPHGQIVILSMHADRMYIHRALQAGAKGYLLKDSAGAEVVKAVQNVHKGKRYVSQPIADILIDDYLNDHRRRNADDPLNQLSIREREILQLVTEGNTSAEIADILCLSPKTVETYRSRLMTKLNVKNTPGLVKFAIRHGLISLEF